MSALVPEPPALVGSPEEGQHGGHEPGHILAQLSAALESPDIKALEWSKDGRGVRVHAELYEEEMLKSKELFPELADLSCVAALKAWMLAYGFKLSKAKANVQVLLLRHPDFQRARPTAKGPGSLGGDAGPSTKQRKARQKTKHVSREAMSPDMPEQQRRKRPSYINFDVPELMHPSAGEDEVPELAQPSPATPGGTAAPQPEDTWASSALEMPAPEEGDECMEIDIDRLFAQADHLMTLLFPQDE